MSILGFFVLTLNDIERDEESVAFFAVKVILPLKSADGLPEISPVSGFSARPSGITSALHVTGVLPDALRVNEYSSPVNACLSDDVDILVYYFTVSMRNFAV